MVSFIHLPTDLKGLRRRRRDAVDCEDDFVDVVDDFVEVREVGLRELVELPVRVEAAEGRMGSAAVGIWPGKGREEVMIGASVDMLLGGCVVM